MTTSYYIDLIGFFIEMLAGWFRITHSYTWRLSSITYNPQTDYTALLYNRMRDKAINQPLVCLLLGDPQDQGGKKQHFLYSLLYPHAFYSASHITGAE